LSRASMSVAKAPSFTAGLGHCPLRTARRGRGVLWFPFFVAFYDNLE